ncbi:SURF1 family protein [Nioella sediminis]|jgi:surfeit locus 1 family protein|uniref:SURF1 family protein n=1 Tax=Nioella sediminis TaxID=1912092 RepID=UPI0008FD5412|nr:SURF1 family protein [Nioella sediminis]TBX29300.1 cytochrome oxidase biogenesis protein Surf1, facilitates heme A insertion [Roseovarius sp. JS7-11]
MKRVILPLLFGVVGCAILLWLGFWQVDRLAWKQALLADIDARIVAAPVDLPETPTEERDQFLPVAVSGMIGEGEITILASLRNAGPVFRIIRDFETEDGRRILIDMGFVRETERETPREGNVPADLVGNLHWPDEIGNQTPAPDLQAGIWFARDIPAMAEALNTEPVLLVLRDPPQTDLGVTPFPVDSGAIPNDHLSYAITWFLLAAVWLGMTLYLVWRISRRAN